MKSKLLTALIAAIGLGAVAAPAQAGVIASTYLNVSNFLLLQQTANGLAAPTGITVLSDNRNGTLSVSYNNANATNSGIGTGTTAMDLPGLSIGPDAGSLPYGPNDATTATTQGMGNFAYSDLYVAGSALGLGTTGFSRADASVTPGSTAAANSEITNNVLATLSFTLSTTETLGFSYDYVALAMADITADLLGTSSNADASTNFSITVKKSGGGSSITLDSLSWAANAFGVAGSNSDSVNDSQTNHLSNFVTLDSGNYQLVITTKSAVNVTALPEPSSIALAGLGLLGIGASLRRRKQA